MIRKMYGSNSRLEYSPLRTAMRNKTGWFALTGILFRFSVMPSTPTVP
jgi:hypothetical protein